MFLAYVLEAGAILTAVWFVARARSRRSRRPEVAVDAPGKTAIVSSVSRDVVPAGWITQEQLEAAAEILHSRLRPPPETVVVVNTTDAVLADALGEEPGARPAAPIDVFVVRGSFTEHGASAQGSRRRPELQVWSASGGAQPAWWRGP